MDKFGGSLLIAVGALIALFSGTCTVQSGYAAFFETARVGYGLFDYTGTGWSSIPWLLIFGVAPTGLGIYLILLGLKGFRTP